MKNLANCGPREFLRQTAKIRHAVEKWLTLTDIMNLRKRMPDIPKDTPKAEKRQQIAEQARKNLMDMLTAIMEKYPDETVDLLALCCFVEPEDADNHPMSEYLGAFAEMMNDKDVAGFFTSLVRLGHQLGLTE